MVSMFTRARAALLGFALFLVPAESWALTTVYIDDVGGTWSGMTPNNGTVSIAPDGSSISWGKTKKKKGKQSGYDFGSLAGSAAHDLGSNIDLGRFTHRNFVIYGSALTSASLAVSITGRLFDGVTSQVFTVNSVFDVRHDETMNRRKSCPYGDSPPCGDLISFLSNKPLTQEIVFNGVTYLFEMTGFLGGWYDGYSLFSDEKRKNSAILQAHLTEVPSTSPVPLPAALPLFAGALMAFGVAKRRKRA
jgi:hypothetical protein